ncbi:armadillo-type protein [Amanita rubescens]|nr:armadillo-type protein [Amanita rubescens]
MSAVSSRKPSGSSTRSRAHSPSDSPSNRNLNLGPAGSMYAASMAPTNSIKGLNSGWQASHIVWNANTSSRRNASVSSAASGNDLSPSQSDNTNYRNLSDSWTTSRPTSATWDDMGDSAPKMEFSQLDPHSQLNYARSRQATITQAVVYTGPRVDDRSKNGRFSPQRYDNIGKDSGNARFNADSPTRGYNSYSGQHSALQGAVPSANFESLQSTSVVNDELSSALRGMAVEDEFSVQSRQQASQTLSASHPRAPPMHQPRGPYSGYAQTDLVLIIRCPGLFYDYIPGARPHGSQYFYPHHQPVMYPPTHSPIINPQLSSPNQGAIIDKKRDLQYPMQQQINATNLLYNAIRSSPSPHQAFMNLEYGMQLPMMLPYGHGPLHMYPQGIRGGRRDGDPSSTLRSALLDEFRANKSKKWELRDIFGYIVEFSGDQHGSRFIQQKLETATSEEKQFVFDEIVPDNALQLIQDVFGNYVIQKLFEHGTQVQKTILANTMEGRLLGLSLQMYGCRVVQKAIEFVLPDQQGAIVKELDPHVLKCVKDSNGNHVIQKLVERVSPERLGFVCMFRGNVYELATHPYGCRVLQRCLEHLPEEHTRPLLDELHSYTNSLMQDQFGNYVVQFVIEHGKPSDKILVLDRLKGNMLKMAQHKFASNVCEKALVCADSENRRRLLHEIMTPKPDGVTPVADMMKDQFANYVLQRALIVAEGEDKDALYSLVRPQLIAMRRFSNAYNKHLGSIERLLEKYPHLPSDHSTCEFVSSEIIR